MDRQALPERLRREGVPKQLYDFRRRKDDVYVLSEEGGKWLVFYLERGSRYDLKSFDKEEDACEDFYNRLHESHQFLIDHHLIDKYDRMPSAERKTGKTPWRWRRMNSYRVTKYDPKFRIDGIYTADEWTSIFDVGQTFSGREFTMREYEITEQNYINFILKTLSACGIEHLTICQPENYGRLRWRDGQRLDAAGVQAFARDCLRERVWGKLQAKHFFVHFGYDYYMYVGCMLDGGEIKKIAEENCLFCENMPSPYL